MTISPTSAGLQSAIWELPSGLSFCLDLGLDLDHEEVELDHLHKERVPAKQPAIRTTNFGTSH